MRRTIRFLSAAAVAIAAIAVPAQAQPREFDDYAARNSFQIRVGAFYPEGGGEFWDATEQVLTLSPNDFDDVTLGFSYVAGVTNHFEVGFNFDFLDADATSVYREDPAYYTDSNLRLTPVTVDFRFLPAGRYSYRGRQGQYAVQQPVPYFGIGAGLNFWSYEEVDYGPDMFFDRREDEGVAFEAHVLAGIEIPVGPSWSFLVEGRYSWSDDEPGDGFAGLGEMQTGGASAYAGMAFRF